MSRLRKFSKLLPSPRRPRKKLKSVPGVGQCDLLTTLPMRQILQLIFLIRPIFRSDAPAQRTKKKKSVTYSVRYPVACERNAKRHTSHGNDVSKRGGWSEVTNEYPTARNPVKNKTTGSPLCVNSCTPSARAQNSVTDIFHHLILNYPALPTRLHPV